MDDEEKGKTENAEESAEEVVVEEKGAQFAQEEEAKEEEKADESAEEEKGDEKKSDEEEVTLPELTDEQRAALAKDPAIQELVRAEPGTGLQDFIDRTLAEAEETKKSEQKAAADKQSLEEAIKAHEDGDDAPLARIAAESYKQALESAQVNAQAEAVMQEKLRPYVEAVYGEQIRALKPDEVQDLDKMSLVDALKELDRRRADAIRGESTSEVDAAKKAAENAANAAKAREEGGGTLPGGSAEEAVGDDIGSLTRRGMEEALDVEEAVGG